MKSCIGFACIGLLIAVSGCKSSGGGSEPDAPEPAPAPGSSYTPCNPAPAPATGGRAALPGGIWQGTLTNELLKISTPFSAELSEDGRFQMRSDGARMAGMVATSGNSFSGDGLAFTWGSWSGQVTHSDFSVDGTIIERASLTATWSMTSGDLGCFVASYDALTYEQPSSLQLVEGVWVSYDGWSFPWYLTIEADGRVLWQDPYFCSMTGQIAIVDDRFNLYDVQQLVSDCDPHAAPYSGFAYLSAAQDGIVLSIDNGRNGYFNSWRR